MHVEFDTPDHAAVIERLLDGFISAGELLIRAGAVGRPQLDVVLQDDDVPSWQLPTTTAERKVCDCEDLVIWWAAWLRACGKHPRARARIKNTGPRQVHCLLDLGDGSKPIDVYDEHLKAQQAQGFQMGGWWSSIKHAASSVGHGISKAAHAVGSAAESAYHGVGKAAGAVGEAAHYVTHELPGAIVREGAGDIKSLATSVGGAVADVVHGVGDAGSQIVDAAGDVVAGSVGGVLHQLGKTAGAVVGSLSGGLGDDVPSSGGGPEGAQGDSGAPMQYGGAPSDMDAYDGDDPFEGLRDDSEAWTESEFDAAADHYDDD